VTTDPPCSTGWSRRRAEPAAADAPRFRCRPRASRRPSALPERRIRHQLAPFRPPDTGVAAPSSTARRTGSQPLIATDPRASNLPARRAVSPDGGPCACSSPARGPDALPRPTGDVIGCPVATGCETAKGSFPPTLHNAPYRAWNGSPRRAALGAAVIRHWDVSGLRSPATTRRHRRPYGRHRQPGRWCRPDAPRERAPRRADVGQADGGS